MTDVILNFSNLEAICFPAWGLAGKRQCCLMYWSSRHAFLGTFVEWKSVLFLPRRLAVCEWIQTRSRWVDGSGTKEENHYFVNRPFPSFLVPLLQNESKCETILVKMSLICMKMKLHVELIFIWKVSLLDSFWNRGTRTRKWSITVSCTVEPRHFELSEETENS